MEDGSHSVFTRLDKDQWRWCHQQTAGVTTTSCFGVWVPRFPHVTSRCDGNPFLGADHFASFVDSAFFFIFLTNRKWSLLQANLHSPGTPAVLHFFSDSPSSSTTQTGPVVLRTMDINGYSRMSQEEEINKKGKKKTLYSAYWFFPLFSESDLMLQMKRNSRRE